MSEESVLIELPKVRSTQTKLPWEGCGAKAYAAALLTALFLAAVCGITVVLRVTLQNSEEEGLAYSNGTLGVAARYLTQPEKATTESSPPAVADHHVVHPVHRRPREFSGNDANAVEGIGAIANSPNTWTGSVRGEGNGTISLDEHGLVFVEDGEEDYYANVATIFNASRDDAEKTARKRSAATLRRGSPPDFSNSFPTVPRSTSSTAASTTTLRTIATTAPAELSSTSTAHATSESTVQVVQDTVGQALAVERRKPFGGSAKSVPISPWLLFCFYDDRSKTRSPGFSVYDFPAQLCTDIVFCCVDVSPKGRLVISKHLQLFLQVLGHEFLPQGHRYLALGGHRVLIHNMDTALQNPALLATRMSDEVLKLGAGGLAIYLEDLGLLKHGLRVHDLIMELRRVRVAVVLPRNMRQQVRYYRTEVYAKTRGKVVITPPSQGYGAESRPRFATCPHPRRSVHEGASLEFVYQLSMTLLSPSAGEAVDYVLDAGDSGSGRTVAAAPRLLVGVSLGGLKFQLKNRSRHEFGSPATFIRRVPYREICKRPWHHWHDNVSECFVAWNGDRAWMSSLGPRSTGFATEMVRGLAVFDVDFDDYGGECGNKFPVLRALRSALISPNRARNA